MTVPVAPAVWSLSEVLHCSGRELLTAPTFDLPLAAQAAVREVHDRDYEMILLEDCCCAFRPGSR